MALPTTYLATAKNIPAFFDSLVNAKAPPAFTQKFIEGLGFKSTNDRLFIGVLKSLGFLDGSASPTERYFKFLDQSESKRVLAEAVEEAYGDLFVVSRKAYELPIADIKNKLRTLTQGKYSDNVIGWMALTFKGLSDYAEWNTAPAPQVSLKQGVTPSEEESESKTISDKVLEEPETEDGSVKKKSNAQFHYNIQVHLPESRDESVYDAIFKSLRRHLL